ncbi:MAG: hypothetical protein WAZ12_03840 [Candidatus Absconditicoccaceae bacterium]
MGKKLIRSFTLLEILFVVIAVSIGLMAVLTSVDYALRNVQSVRQKVIAINLAREGLEGIYQIRDTNRLIGPAKKDVCRLDMNPLVDEPIDGCTDDSWMGSGNYILQKIYSGNQQSFSLSGGGTWNELDLSNGIQPSDNKFALCMSGNLRESCPDYNGQVTYFRQIHGEGLFYKDSNTTGGDYLDCNDGMDANFFPNLDCGGIEAKEYRFCSKVAYMGQGRGEIELCGLITNFSK